MTPDTAQRLGAVPLDFALTDGPRLADHARPQLPLADLDTQRRRRQSQKDCRLSEGEHLAGQSMVAPSSGADAARRALGAAYLGRQHHLADEVLREVALVEDPLGGHRACVVLDVHLVPLRAAVDIQKIRAIAYIVKRQSA